MTPLRCVTLAIAGIAVPLLASLAIAEPAKLVSESYQIPARDPGVQLYVRNKRPEAMTTFASDRILLFVHGATYPRRPPSTSRSTAYRGWTTSLNAATTCI